MSDKQALLEAVENLPDEATLSEMTDVLLGVIASRAPASDLARLNRAKFGAEQLAEYLDPKFEFTLDEVLAELEAMPELGAK